MICLHNLYYKINLYLFIKTILVLSIGLLYANNIMGQAFIKDQLRYERVRQAKADKETLLQKEFETCGLSYPPKNIFIRIFKHEAQLELWVKEGEQYELFKTYPFCYASGKLGPKRKQGDLQVPEGVYYIDRFNPFSNFYLSLGINYPTQEDRKLAHSNDPGGDIFIHGDCVSIGCVAITDDLIKEVYWLAALAKSSGQQKILVHLFPFQLNHTFKWLRFKLQYPQHQNFWKDLLKPFEYFEKHKDLKN